VYIEHLYQRFERTGFLIQSRILLALRSSVALSAVIPLSYQLLN